MAKIIVLLEDGTVKAVEGVPADMYVEVRNYDIDRLVQNVVSRDENGRSVRFENGAHLNRISLSRMIRRLS